MVVGRINALFSLLLASVISVIYVPFPDFCSDIVYYLVKRTARIIENDESEREPVCEDVQPDGEDSCSVVEENESSDGEDVAADEHTGDDQRESDGSEDEQRS
jgi:hypothetical protein